MTGSARAADGAAATIALEVNGSRVEVTADPPRSLLTVLRDELGLRGAKPACGEGVCGACTVLVDGAVVRACVAPVSDLAGRRVTTIEGIAAGALHPVQQAFLDEHAFQCGYCTPGMVLATIALIGGSGPDDGTREAPDEAAVRTGLDGNICRCCTYPRILRAVAAASKGDGPPAGERRPSADARSAPPMLRPASDTVPWDRREPEERGYFEALGDGIVAVLPPPDEDSPWSRVHTTSGGAWLHVGRDGVTAFSGKVEMGQGTTTGLARVVARSIRAPLEAVRMVMADTDLSPFDIGTFGSRSVPDAGEMLRACGETAREALVALASRRLEVAAPDLVAQDGAIRTRDGARALTYAELVDGVRRIDVVRRGPESAAPGERAAAPDAPERAVPDTADLAVVTGRRTFATDVALPGMLVGAELPAPAAGARLRRVDTSAARAIPGVTVVELPGSVAVAAEDRPMLDRALATLEADWDLPAGPSSAGLFDELRRHPIEEAGWNGSFADASGNVAAALESAAVRLTATYTVAPVAHMPLERRAAVAKWRDGRLTAWLVTQIPFGARAEIADALDLAEDDVRVIVPPMGAGFGGRHGARAAIVAATLARTAGRPVGVRWRHADELLWGHVRPPAVIDVTAGAGADGSITAWDVLDINAGANSIRPPYRIPNRRLRFRPADSPLPEASYRALAATANTFAREVMVDELAHALGIDPLAFRTANATSERLAHVLEVAAGRAGWAAGRDAPGVGLGIAGSFEKDAFVATCAEVEIGDDGRVRVSRLVTAFDCGAIVDRDNLANQVEGATVMALGPALFEAIELEDGRVANPTLGSYRVPRFSDVPRVEVELVDRPDVPSAGGGEVPLIAVAPAISNAIFAASGRRLRTMPLVPDGVLPAPSE